MTKSQNTKNEQHCIKQNEKSFIQKDLSLTELWKKGELPSGWYYVRLIRGEYRIDLYINGKNEWIDCPDNIIDTVVCEVPTYDEWKASEKYNKHLEEVIKVYERKDKQATETSIAYNELLEENAKLKELLKECESSIQYYQETYGAMDLDTYTLIAKLKEALK